MIGIHSSNEGQEMVVADLDNSSLFLPAGWSEVPLSEVLIESDVRAGDDGPGARDFPVLSLTKNDGLVLQSDRFSRRIATEDVSNYKLVRRDQIVYNPYVIWEGAVHIQRRFDAGLVSPVYPVWSVIPGKADARYVDSFLRLPSTLEAYSRFSSGAVNRRRSIRKDDFLRIRIPYPPVVEQTAIASVLLTIQQAIEAADKVIAATRVLKQSMLKHLFTYGPVSVEAITSVTTRETDLGTMPENWRVDKLSNLITSAQYGISQRGNKVGQIPILRMNNLNNGVVSTSDLQYVDLDAKTLTKFRLRPGDILFNRTNSFELVGKTSLFDISGDFVFASYLVRVVTDRKQLDPSYATYYMNASVGQAQLKTFASRGVSQSNISASKLRGFHIPLPPLDEQREIARILAAIDHKLVTENQRKTALHALFKSALEQLMTGKIRLGTEFMQAD